MTRRHDSKYRPAPDPYAHARCICRHLLYEGDVPGDGCLWCACSDHRPASQQEVRP